MIGVILAGGEARRMGGGDKGLALVGGIAILDRIVASLRAQCDDILISANGDPTRFARFDCPVVADARAGCGPLAGVLAALDAVSRLHPGARFTVTAPTDTPFLPPDLVVRLAQARAVSGAAMSCARSGGRVHPVATLWPVALRADLRVALEADGVRQMRSFLQRHPVAYADWPILPHDPFFNVNTANDLAAAQAIAASLTS